MILPARTLRLRTMTIKDQTVLALDTGVSADSLEGLRMVKASRGSGWIWTQSGLRPWVTRGVQQDEGRLVVWGDSDPIPEGHDGGPWPLSGEEGRAFLRAFTLAWTAWAALETPLPAFSASALLSWKTPEGWAFVLPPPELRAGLDSLLSIADRLPWEHLRHPDLSGVASWSFATATLALINVAGTLPWNQSEEESLRQEIRDLKRTFTPAELPSSLREEQQRLWSDAFVGKTTSTTLERWAAWALNDAPWTSPVADPLREAQTQRALLRRQRRRQGSHFWRRRGAVIGAVSAVASVVLIVLAMMIWGAIKPDPTDVWNPEQVVRGYYDAMARLDGELLRKVTQFDRGKEVELSRDQDQATNLYVVRQIRIAYEHESPVVDAQQWLDSGRPGLKSGNLLYGVVGLTVERSADGWVARYQKWISENPRENVVVAVGNQVEDQLILVSTGRGWKISSLHRKLQPLP